MVPARPRIFISHSHLDNNFGTKLAQDLRRVLTDEDAVFYDVMGGLHGGERWWNKIVKELTARNVFLLVLSPDSMNSQWVLREIDVALNENKYIIPILHRTCNIRADLKILQIISFLAPKSYGAAFQEVLGALGLPKEPLITQQDSGRQPTESTDVATPQRVWKRWLMPGGRQPTESTDVATVLIQQMETAFNDHDWPNVIRKANYLIRRTAGNVSSTVYRLQGLALLEEGEVQQAQEALETALALVSNRQQRLTLLSDYTALFAQQEQWAKVLQQSKEALRLMPNDPGWLATQQQAQNQLLKTPPVPSLSAKKTHITDHIPSSTLQETREQWINEGNTYYALTMYEKAIAAYDLAISLDPNYANAYYNKGSVLSMLEKYREAQLEEGREAQKAYERAKQLGYKG
jgi:TIR domain/TPR repeat